MAINLKDAEPGKISAWYDGEDLPENGIVLGKSDRAHMQNWSLIGSVMRGELSVRAPASFADSVMAKIGESTAAPAVDQAEVSSRPVPAAKTFFRGKWRRAAFFFTQAAVAASIAMVTVFGWQTWNAGDNFSLSDPAANAVMGPVSVNLASYQSANTDKIINLDANIGQSVDVRRARSPVNREIRQMQGREAERINAYLRGYVLNTAAN